MQIYLTGFRVFSLLCLLSASADHAGAIAQENMTFVSIPAGVFYMGAMHHDPAASPDEWPRHEVQIADAYALSTTLVTRGAFAAFVAATSYHVPPGCWTLTEAGWNFSARATWRNPGFEQTDAHPVVCVSRADALSFLHWAGVRDQTSYRLPSEAEWDHAARLDGAAPWHTPAQICDYGNVNDLTAKNKVAKVAEPCEDGFLFTSPVAHFRAGPYGLYDMIGNVWEWTEDCAHDDYTQAPVDGSAARRPHCTTYVLRGHSWTDAPGPVRLETRLFLDGTERQSLVGFRVAKENATDAEAGPGAP